jgi:RNA polymerase subunit RPABC4/transcription elongation factor Spt4
MRRRLRFLRRLRELGYRDLGGLVFEQHRFARPDPELVRGKIAALAAVDGELRTLEAALGERRTMTELREPGLTACARCGAVIGSDARFCSACGAPVGGAPGVATVGGPAATAPDPVQQAPAPPAPGTITERLGRRALARRAADARQPSGRRRPVSAHAADPDAIACPRCGRPVGGDQAWCLNCGAAARTRLVPAPAGARRWRSSPRWAS